MDWAFSYLSDTPGSTPPGRAADCLPQGGTPPPARPLFTASRVRSVLSLSISAISAALICTIVFGHFSRSKTRPKGFGSLLGSRSVVSVGPVILVGHRQTLASGSRTLV